MSKILKKLTYKILVGLAISLLLVVYFGATSNFVLAEPTFYFEDGIIYGYSTAPTQEVEVVIPAEINNVPVTKLLSNHGDAVDFCNDNIKDLITSVDLSNATNLVEIGNVFCGCSNLTGTITLLENVKKIYRYSFSGTAIDKVIVSHSDTSLNIIEGAFPEGTTIVFQSQSVMEAYVSEYDIWDSYNLSYQYNLRIDMGNSIITTFSFEKGQTLGEAYNQIVNTYFSDYDNVELYQGDEKVSADTILDGSDLIFVNSVDYTYSLEFDYGECVEIIPETSGQNYIWKFNGEVISNSSTLLLSDLNVGEYIYTLKVEADGVSEITIYNIIINPKKYDFSWPVKAKYEYFEISDETFVNSEHDGKVNLSYFIKDGSDYTSVETLSIGTFKVVATPIDSNYYIENDSFEFVIDYSYLTIAWASSTYQYTGEYISPEFYLVGDMKGFDVKIVTEDSTIRAREVGEYTINIVGLSNEFFALTSDTTTIYNWQIVPTELTIDWNQNELEYGSLSQNVQVNGVCEDISIPLVVTDLEGNSLALCDVGTYDVKVEVPSTYTGFSLNGSEVGTIEVMAKKLDVVFTCDDTYYYNGEYVLITATITTEIDDDVELILEGNYQKDAGSYTAKVVGVNNSNYYVDEGIEFAWKILPKQLVVSWYNLTPQYNGEVRKPHAVVETGIEGEELTLIVDTDNNVNANEDSAVGYTATARLSESDTNYNLSNAQVEYFIRRATPIFIVNPTEEVVYNGKHQLPTFELVGDINSLKIFVNGIETQQGVKEPGNYSITFTCAKSLNYNAFVEEYACAFTIRASALSKDLGKLNVSIQHENGFYENELYLEEITEHYIEIINEINKLEDYNLYKAFTIPYLPEVDDSEVTIQLSIQRTNPEKIKVYLMSGRALHEIECEVVDGVVTFSGEFGSYYVFVEKSAWITTTFGIITMTSVAVILLSLLVYFTMFKGKRSESRKIAELIEIRLQEKIANREEISTSDTLQIRKEVIEELKQNKNKNKTDKKC